MSVRVVAAGHPAVTGRHGKTLELTAEADITPRASCVLGTAAGPLPGGLVRLRGRVRLRLAVGDLAADIEGEVNPAYASASRLVVRRSDVLDPDTYLVNASAAAADLDRSLIARLRDPDARLELTATEVGNPPPVLLVLAGAPPAAWAALTTQLDHVLDLTDPTAPPPWARRTAPARPPPGGTADAGADAGAGDAADAAASGSLAGGAVLAGRRWRGVPAEAAALAGARTAAVLAPDLAALTAPVRERLAAALPGARVLLWPPAPGVDLLLAAGRPPAPVLHAGRLPTAARELPALAALLAAAPAATLTVDPAAPPAQLDELRGRLPDHELLVPDPAVGWGVGALTVPPGAALPGLAGLRRAPTAAFARGDGPAPLAVDPAALARALRAAGLSGRSAAAVLTGLGVPRRAAYDLAADPCGYPEGPSGPAR